MRGGLAELRPCFQGVIPSILATCSAEGEPNVTYLSQVHYVDEGRVALSCQFFNKTRRNVEENPWATVIVLHPVSLRAWRLRLRFDHAETRGPLFDRMALRIEVIAGHTGMKGVFRLLSADVYEVMDFCELEGFLLPPDPLLDALPLPSGPLTELRGVQLISDRIARAADLEELLGGALVALDEVLGFSHSMILVPCEDRSRLVALASRGYEEEGVGAEVRWGEGVLGVAAERREVVRLGGMDQELRYGRAIRHRVEECGEADRIRPEIPLPGLRDAQAQLAVPLLAHGRLTGVLALESRDPLAFDEWDEAFLQILGNQIAMGMEAMQETDEEETGSGPAAASRAGSEEARRVFTRYAQDDCIFVDGEYLIRQLPGRILWKLLTEHARDGRVEFTNRELRLDPSLGLPPVKDNLESRLILLRKRLAAKCPDVALVPVRRGRFALRLTAAPHLEERP